VKNERAVLNRPDGLYKGTLLNVKKKMSAIHFASAVPTQMGELC
jgi:hypothetical protein